MYGLYSTVSLLWILYRGVLVPVGFGSRGAEGKILAAKWARENKKPYLGTLFAYKLT